MMKSKSTKSESMRKIYAKNRIMALLTFALAVGIIIALYSMVFTEKKKSIIKDDEVAARKSADSIELYIATNMDSVKLVAYALDEMITKNRSDEEIQDFLGRQSVIKKNALDPDSTGFYAYINRRFFSGVYWVPPEDYDATVRPWYTKPFEAPGEVTILEPYLDLETGIRKMALGTVLCDGVSVVSIDLVTTPIQMMVDEAVKHGDADICLVISPDNIVIAHSDASEVGRDYDEESGSIGAMISKNLRENEDYDFEFKYNGINYIVYVASMQRGYKCLSIRNATIAFEPLWWLLAATILVIVLCLVLIIYIINNSQKIMSLSGSITEKKSAKENIFATRIQDFLENTLFRSGKAIPLSTRLRWMVLIVLISAETLIGSVAIIQTRVAVRSSLCQRMIDIANCAAGTVDGNILRDIKAEDQGTEKYQKIYDALAVYRDNVELEYVYAIKVEEDGRYTFSVDPDFFNPAEFGKELEPTEGLYHASQGIASVDDFTASDEWGTFYSAYSPVLDSDGNIAGLIGVDFSVDWFEGQLNRQSQQIILSYLIVLVITIAITWILSYFAIRAITNPLKRMTEVAVHYGQGDFAEKIEMDRPDEIGVLSHTLQSMAGSLKEQISRAEEASRAKSNFLANMSHEIRTPINTMLGMNEMILRESGEKNILSYAESVKNAGRNLLNLINDILDFSKIEAGKTEITAVNYYLHDLLEELSSMIRPMAEVKKLKFNTSFDKEMPEILMGDENRVRQVISNLLTNAVKYTHEGSIAFNVDCEKVPGEDDSVILNISVSDTGVGIRKEDMPKLFNKFERIDEKKNRNIQGTGLGLNITESLLELMGSSLEVESEFGRGSVFSFKLKQKVESWKTEEIAKESQENRTVKSIALSLGFTAPSARVLAVDDNPMNLMVLANLIKHIRVQLDTADGPEMALELMAENKYDLVFLDHMMPIKDGIEVLHEVKEKENNLNFETPMVCLTANAISGAREYYLSEGFDDYLTKPIGPKDLDEMVLRFLPDEMIIMGQDTRLQEEPQQVENKQEELSFLEGQGVIDKEAGIRNNGSVSAYLAILRMFEEQIDGFAQELDNLYQQKDLENYTIKVHALKSSARMIGALKFGEKAQELENAGKAKDLDYIGANHGAFLDEYRGFKELLKQLKIEREKDSEADMDKPLANALLMNKMYNDLRSAADDMDTIRMDEIFLEMDGYRIPEPDNKLFNKLKAAADNFEYDSVLELINNELQDCSSR